MRAGIPCDFLDCSDGDARDLYGCDLALIRPDQHVAWRGNQLPADCDRLLAKLTGSVV